MRDRSLGSESDAGSRGDGLHAGCWPPSFLVAAHELVVDVGQTLAGPLVGGSADEFPLPAGLAVGDEVGEDVCGSVRG